MMPPKVVGARLLVCGLRLMVRFAAEVNQRMT
jgi:hypothetical protein